MEKIRYEEMLPHEIVARRERFPAAFIGVGGLEWHGEHQAVGLDALKAQKICELAAEKSGGFAMPTVWYGEPRTLHLMESDVDPDGRITQKMNLPASSFKTEYFGVSQEEQVKFFRQLIFHILVQMNTLGMKAVCLLAGHYPLMKWARESIGEFGKVERFRGTRAYCAIEPFYVREDEWENPGGDHAAKWETSYLMYLRPECVDMSVYKGRVDGRLIGVMGEDPRMTASRELGEKGVGQIVDGMVRKAKELIS